MKLNIIKFCCLAVVIWGLNACKNPPLQPAIAEEQAATDQLSIKAPASLDPGVREAFDLLGSQGGFSGAVLIVRDGQELFAKAYGSKQLPEGPQNTVETVFGIGSLSKQFAAVAILLLREENKLALTDQLEKFLPNLKDADQFSIKNLLAHRSGAPGFANLEKTNGQLYKRLSSLDSLEQFIDSYANVGARRVDGSAFEYNNYGFMLLSRVVEVVAKMSFGEFLQKKVFDPTGMSNTSLRPFPTTVMAQGYYPSEANGSPILPAELENHLIVAGSGGIFSTVRDLQKWNEALNDGSIINSESLQLMQTPINGSVTEVAAEPAAANYGFGLVIRKVNGKTVTEHSGSVNGYQSNSLYATAGKTSFIWLANFLGQNPAPAIDQTMQALFGGTGRSSTANTSASDPAREEVQDQALIYLDGLVREKSIDARWRDQQPTKVRSQNFGNGPEWVVEFANPAGSILYLFMDQRGQYLGHNFDGS